MYLTRKQYDKALEMFPAYMAQVWPTLGRYWGVNGVYVTRYYGSGLRELVEQLNVR